MSYQIADILPKGDPLKSRRYKTFQEFAQAMRSQLEEDARPLNKEELATLKEVWKQHYHQAYYQERKQREKRVTLRMTHAEYAYLQASVRGHVNEQANPLSFNKAIKEFALAYAQQKYIPTDKSVVRELITEIRRVGNNINQISRTLHRQSKVEPSKFELLEATKHAQNAVLLVEKLQKNVIDRLTTINIKDEENISDATK